MILIIVEAPGKLPTLRKYLPDDEYRVEATSGHIIDLDKHKMSINFENDFQPIYTPMEGKIGVINKLIDAYNECDDILIAADKDREGEMIAWSVAKELGLKNPKRITFGDTTKQSILNAIKTPGKINNHVVDAQKLRRLLDRIIGYFISPILCKSLGVGNLGAGRVQSVVVKLIIEREKSIQEFFEGESECYFCTNGDFINNKKKIHANLYTTDTSDQSNNDTEDEDVKPTKKNKKNKKTENSEEDEVNVTKGFQSKIKSSSLAKSNVKKIIKSTFKISDVSSRDSTRQPSPPFTTATMLQEASRKIGMSTERTTKAAQHLYEAAYITYIRTDSTNMAEEAIKSIGKFVANTYGKNMHRPINYSVKSKNAQEAHEAIRPTDPKHIELLENHGKKIFSDEVRLYNLIWKRTIASQMAPAIFNVVTVKISISELKKYFFVSQSEEVKFLGFLSVYDMKNTEEEDEDSDNDETEKTGKIYIPKKGTDVNLTNLVSFQNYKKPPGRYNEASLINKLDIKNLNIGRPATIPPIMKKIQDKEYVKKKDCKGVTKDSITLTWNNDEKKLNEDKKQIVLGKDTNRFAPTNLGTMVTEFLDTHFPDIMDYKFTAGVEDQLDEVANGKVKWNDVLREFYNTFEPLIEKLNNTLIPKSIMNKNDRELGIDPKTGNMIIAGIRKHGPVVILTASKKSEENIAPIKDPFTLKKITLEDALKILEYPINLGKYLKKTVLLKIGEYGFFLEYGTSKDSRISLSHIDKTQIKDFDIDDAKQLIDEHQKKILWQNHDNNNKYVIREHEEYGKYISVVSLNNKYNKKPKFVGLPKDIDINDLTLEKIVSIVSKSKKTYGKGKKQTTPQKKTTDKTTKKTTDTTTKKVTKKPTSKKSSNTNSDSSQSLFASHAK